MVLAVTRIPAALAGAALTMVATQAAHADDAALSTATAFFQAGSFDAAADVAGEEADADAQALAAKALNVQAIFAPAGAERDALIAGASGHAERALALDPSHIEGRLQLAIVLWLEGRELSRWASFRRGLPQQGRDILESVLADAPDEPWAHALMGAWHFEVARRGGRAGMALMGARTSEGVDRFYEAMRLDPDDAAIAAQCAISFLALDIDVYGEAARVALENALAAQADDAFERAMQDEAAALARLFDAGDTAGLEAALSRFVDG